MCHAVDQATAYLSIHLIELFVPRNQGPGGLRVFPNVGIHRVAKHSHRVFLDRGNPQHLWQWRVLIQLPRLARDIGRLVRHALEIAAEFHR